MVWLLARYTASSTDAGKMSRRDSTIVRSPA
jgi:hypothetical protein